MKYVTAATDESPATAVEVICPHCSADVSESEISANQCHACGGDITVPQQNVTIEVKMESILGSTM